MTRLITACPPSSLWGLALAFAAIALHAALSAPGPSPLPGSAEAEPEAPACVGCHSSEWPSPAPEAPNVTLSQAERAAIAAMNRRAP